LRARTLRGGEAVQGSIGKGDEGQDEGVLVVCTAVNEAGCQVAHGPATPRTRTHTHETVRAHTIRRPSMVKPHEGVR
jgi:hypothetical protein